VESKTAAWRVLGTDGKTLQDALDVLKSEDKENWTDTYTLDNQGRKVMAQRNTKTGELRVVDRAPVTQCGSQFHRSKQTGRGYQQE
jgi:hypothetical protein